MNLTNFEKAVYENNLYDLIYSIENDVIEDEKLIEMLILSCKVKTVDIIKELVELCEERGIDILKLKSSEINPCKNGLLDYNFNVYLKLIHVAAGANVNEGVIEYLLSKGFDVNDNDNSMNVTPLFIAAGDNPNLVELLLKLGGDPEIKSKFNEKPLSFAMNRPHRKSFDLLVNVTELNDDIKMNYITEGPIDDPHYVNSLVKHGIEFNKSKEYEEFIINYVSIKFPGALHSVLSNLTYDIPKDFEWTVNFFDKDEFNEKNHDQEFLQKVLTLSICYKDISFVNKVISLGGDISSHTGFAKSKSILSMTAANRPEFLRYLLELHPEEYEYIPPEYLEKEFVKLINDDETWTLEGELFYQKYYDMSDNYGLVVTRFHVRYFESLAYDDLIRDSGIFYAIVLYNPEYFDILLKYYKKFTNTEILSSVLGALGDYAVSRQIEYFVRVPETNIHYSQKGAPSMYEFCKLYRPDLIYLYDLK